MCDNCNYKKRTPSYEALKVSVEQQRRIIDQLETDAGKQQVALGELQTENLALRTENSALRTTIAGIYAWMQKHIEVLEKENQRREASILYMSEAGAA